MGNRSGAGEGGARLLRPVSAEEVDRFWDEGVVCLRGIIDPADVAAMEGPVEEAAAGPETADMTEMGRALASGGSGGSGGDGGEGGAETGAAGRFRSGVDHWLVRPVFAAFSGTGALPAIAGALLRADRVHLYEDSVLVKEPLTSERTEWHQDLSYFHVAGDQLCTTWVPLDPVTPETGAMRFVRASHRSGRTFRPNLFVTRTELPGTEGEQVPDVDGVDGGDVVTFSLGPGDLTVHHARTLHAAGPNTSATLRRRAISTRYCGDDARYRIRPGVPRKAHHHDDLEGASLEDRPESPVVWQRG